MKQMTHLLLVAALLGMPIQGCKKEGPTESPAQSPAPPVQTAFPTGTFRATDSEGQWVQVYNTDSTFTLTRNGVRMFTQGRYTPSARQVMLSENSQLCSGMACSAYETLQNSMHIEHAVVGLIRGHCQAGCKHGNLCICARCIHKLDSRSGIVVAP